MPTTTSYSLALPAHQRLESLVDSIEHKPGDMIRLHEFEELQERMNVRSVLETLPEGLSDDDFADILRLAMLTECATESYGAVFKESARAYDAPWLARFNERVWVPDELTHATPYRLILHNLGFSDADLARQIRHTQEIDYIHRGGTTPVHLTTFGTIQEYLTDNWHGLVAKLMKKAAPEAAYMATRIKRRETLHTVWYRDMTALQVEANPSLLRSVAEGVVAFEMPGNALVPELQRRATEWLPKMGANFDQIARDMVRLLYESVGDTRRAGELLLEVAAAKGIALGPLSPHHVHAALNRLGGPGFGILGEAMLERVGLTYVFRQPAGTQDRGFAPYNALYEKVRGLVRSWIAKQLDLRISEL
jgi:hypothetical protein